VAEHGFKFFELDGGEVRHVTSDHLVLEESKFFGNGVADKTELVLELVVGVGCEVVFFNVGFGALLVYGGNEVQVFVQWRERFANLLCVVQLVLYIAFQS
jgi:hypothetical protein